MCLKQCKEGTFKTLGLLIIHKMFHILLPTDYIVWIEIVLFLPLAEIAFRTTEQKNLECGEALEIYAIHNRYHNGHFMCNSELVIRIC
jgi:hypothetical protein